MPATEKFVTVLTGDVAAVIVAVPDADGSSVHVPVPVAAMVAEPPGTVIQGKV